MRVGQARGEVSEGETNARSTIAWGRRGRRRAGTQTTPRRARDRRRRDSPDRVSPQGAPVDRGGRRGIGRPEPICTGWNRRLARNAEHDQGQGGRHPQTDGCGREQALEHHGSTCAGESSACRNTARATGQDAGQGGARPVHGGVARSRCTADDAEGGRSTGRAEAAIGARRRRGSPLAIRAGRQPETCRTGRVGGRSGTGVRRGRDRGGSGRSREAAQTGAGAGVADAGHAEPTLWNGIRIVAGDEAESAACGDGQPGVRNALPAEPAHEAARHSVEKGSGGAALEEERRGCFVAVTRTRTHLILSRARYYRGWPKAPSRFLVEMGCLGDHGSDTAARQIG